MVLVELKLNILQQEEMIGVFLKWSLEAFNATSDSKVCTEYSHKVIYPVVHGGRTKLRQIYLL